MALASVALASSITTPTQVGRWLLQPSTTYNNAYLDFSNVFVVAAIAKGTLVFNDGTNSLGGWNTNPTVQQLIQNWNFAKNDSLSPASGTNQPNDTPLVQP